MQARIFLTALLVFFVIDMVWLGLLAKNFYRQQLGFLMKSDFNWFAAGAFYLVFIFGLAVFVIAPSIEKGSLINALLMGALFGLVTYSTYDLTNLATLKDWPLALTFIDLAWGTFLAASVSSITYLLVGRIGQ